MHNIVSEDKLLIYKAILFYYQVIYQAYEGMQQKICSLNTWLSG